MSLSMQNALCQVICCLVMALLTARPLNASLVLDIISSRNESADTWYADPTAHGFRVVPLATLRKGPRGALELPTRLSLLEHWRALHTPMELIQRTDVYSFSELLLISQGWDLIEESAQANSSLGVWLTKSGYLSFDSSAPWTEANSSADWLSDMSCLNMSTTDYFVLPESQYISSACCSCWYEDYRYTPQGLYILPPVKGVADALLENMSVSVYTADSSGMTLVVFSDGNASTVQITLRSAQSVLATNRTTVSVLYSGEFLSRWHALSAALDVQHSQLGVQLTSRGRLSSEPNVNISIDSIFGDGVEPLSVGGFSVRMVTDRCTSSSLHDWVLNLSEALFANGSYNEISLAEKHETYCTACYESALGCGWVPGVGGGLGSCIAANAEYISSVVVELTDVQTSKFNCSRGLFSQRIASPEMNTLYAVEFTAVRAETWSAWDHNVTLAKMSTVDEMSIERTAALFSSGNQSSVPLSAAAKRVVRSRLDQTSFLSEFGCPIGAASYDLGNPCQTSDGMFAPNWDYNASFKVTAFPSSSAYCDPATSIANDSRTLLGEQVSCSSIVSAVFDRAMPPTDTLLSTAVEWFPTSGVVGFHVFSSNRDYWLNPTIDLSSPMLDGFITAAFDDSSSWIAIKRYLSLTVTSLLLAVNVSIYFVPQRSCLLCIHGVCDKNFKCVCHEGWSGPGCATPSNGLCAATSLLPLECLSPGAVVSDALMECVQCYAPGSACDAQGFCSCGSGAAGPRCEYQCGFNVSAASLCSTPSVRGFCNCSAVLVMYVSFEPRDIVEALPQTVRNFPLLEECMLLEALRSWNVSLYAECAAKALNASLNISGTIALQPPSTPSPVTKPPSGVTVSSFDALGNMMGIEVVCVVIVGISLGFQIRIAVGSCAAQSCCEEDIPSSVTAERIEAQDRLEMLLPSPKLCSLTGVRKGALGSTTHL